MTEQLKPCPFCGGDPKTTERPDNIDGTRFFYAVACYCDGYSACAHKMAVEPTPQQAEAVPSDVVCAVAAEREACARQCEDIYSWRGAYSAGPMCARTLEAAAAAIRARGHATIAQQKGQP